MQANKEIPEGYCQCGCGQKTKISKINRPNRNWIKGKPKRFINGHNKTGERNHNWRGGIAYKTVGKNKLFIREHVLVAEKALGKSLPKGAEVHHVSGGKNGGPLVICQDRAYHILLHQRTEALRVCGHATWRKCWICQTYDAPENLSITIRKATGYSGPILHLACGREYKRKRYAERKL